MERRMILAAITAAIAAPELSAWDFEKNEKRPDSPEAAAVREWAVNRIIERLWGINSAGPATLVDAVMLADVLDQYNNEKRDDFGGLLNFWRLPSRMSAMSSCPRLSKGTWSPLSRG